MSTADEFERLSDELLDRHGHPVVKLSELPDLLEQCKDLDFFSADVIENIRVTCLGLVDAGKDPELAHTELVNLMSVLAQDRQRSGATSPASATSPPAKRLSRRTSDRIRSPSDSSSSDDAYGDSSSAKHSKLNHSTSSIPRAFPGSNYALPSATKDLPRPQPIRTKSISDTSAREESPFSARSRASEKYNNIGSAAFSRPNPPNAWRRHSRELSRGPDDLPKSPESARSGPSRSTSIASSIVAASSPPSSVHLQSPSSPALDSTSYVAAFLTSPTQNSKERGGEDGGVSHEPDIMLLNDIDDIEDSLRLPNGGDHKRDLERLAKITTTSSTTLRDEAATLRTQLADAQRKLRETEVALQRQLADSESMAHEAMEMYEDEQSKHKETRREAEVLRAKNASLTTDVAGLEQQIAGLKSAQETYEETLSGLQKRYQAQLKETQDLRELLDEKEQLIANHESEQQEWREHDERREKEHSALSRENRQLKDELLVASQTKVQLDVQKTENLTLRETIDRLRQDLSTSMSPSSKAPGAKADDSTLSKSLGFEIRDLFGEKHSEDDLMGASEIIAKTTTITRTYIRGGNEVMRSETLPEGTAIAIVDENDVLDRDALASPLSSPSTPKFTSLPSLMSDGEDDVHQPYDEHFDALDDDDEDAYMRAAKESGVHCPVMEDAYKQRKARGEISKRRPLTFNIYGTEFTAPGLVCIASWTMVGVAIGISAGSIIYSKQPAYEVPARFQYLLGAGMVGEGVLPHARQAWEGYKLGGNIIPT